MKKLLLILGLLITSFASNAQWYNQPYYNAHNYGNEFGKLQIDSTFTLLLLDTNNLYTGTGHYPFILRLNSADSNLYLYNGLNWKKVGGSSATPTLDQVLTTGNTSTHGITLTGSSGNISAQGISGTSFTQTSSSTANQFPGGLQTQFINVKGTGATFQYQFLPNPNISRNTNYYFGVQSNLVDTIVTDTRLLNDTLSGSGTNALLMTTAGTNTKLSTITLDKAIQNGPNTARTPDFINGFTVNTPTADGAPRCYLTINGGVNIYDTATGSTKVGPFGGEYGAGNANNTIFGYNIQVHSEQYASLFGYHAGQNISGQSYNSGFGWIALENVSGPRNNGFGVGACDACGTDNCGFGYDAGAYNTGINKSIFIGNKAGYNLGHGVPNIDGMFVIDCSAGNGYNSFLIGNGAADGGGNITSTSYLARNYSLDSLYGKTVYYDKVGTQGEGLVPIYAYNKITGQTSAGNITTYTTTADGVFEVSGYLAVIAVATDVIKYQVSYTDENNNARTQDFYPQGTTTATIAATGSYPYSSMQIWVKASTVITLKTFLTNSSGSITFDACGSIKQIGK